MTKQKSRLDLTTRAISEQLGVFELILWFVAATSFVSICGKATHSSSVVFHTLAATAALQLFCIVALAVKPAPTRLALMALVDIFLLLYTVAMWRYLA
jgi:hypothetical protein